MIEFKGGIIHYITDYKIYLFTYFSSVANLILFSINVNKQKYKNIYCPHIISQNGFLFFQRYYLYFCYYKYLLKIIERNGFLLKDGLMIWENSHENIVDTWHIYNIFLFFFFLKKHTPKLGKLLFNLKQTKWTTKETSK